MRKTRSHCMEAKVVPSSVNFFYLVESLGMISATPERRNSTGALNHEQAEHT